jgi:hypothetical protein
MAASVSKGDYGHLHRPKLRIRQLKRLAHLTLEAAANKLKLGKERTRQLYFIYKVPRKKHIRRRRRKTVLHSHDYTD